MKFTILTFFPDIFKTYLGSVAPLKKAIGNKVIEIEIKQIRDFTKDKHNRCDGYPYGGGAGLILFCQPIIDAIESIEKPGRVIFTSPSGRKFDHDYALGLSKEKHVIIVAGRYEGYDKRIFDLVEHEKVSAGDYVLTGGETAALIIVDAVARHVENVLDNEESLSEESFTEGFLEYDQFTRPAVYRDLEVPEVLTSGHHGKIKQQREKWSLINTYENRPDLLKNKALSDKQIETLKQYIKEKYSGS